MRLFLILLGLLVLAGIGGAFQHSLESQDIKDSEAIVDYESCVAAGNPVLESYPEQCRTLDGRSFTRNIGNELQKVDLIRSTTPRPGDSIVSPLELTGEARGYWFFEANAPVVLLDSSGNVIAEHYIQSIGAWMTEDFVSYEGVLEFDVPDDMHRGTLVLKKANASGLPEHDDALEIPVFFK